MRLPRVSAAGTTPASGTFEGWARVPCAVVEGRVIRWRAELIARMTAASATKMKPARTLRSKPRKTRWGGCSMADLRDREYPESLGFSQYVGHAPRRIGATSAFSQVDAAATTKNSQCRNRLIICTIRKAIDLRNRI